eukprot:618202_1
MKYLIPTILMLIVLWTLLILFVFPYTSIQSLNNTTNDSHSPVNNHKNIHILNEAGFSNRINTDTGESKHNLCVFVWGTTYNERFVRLLKEIMSVYRDREDVYYMMDDFKSPLQYTVCNITTQCIFTDYLTGYRDRYRLSEKTIASFQHLYDHAFYDKCNWLMKIDTDSYVDVDRFSDFLLYNYDENQNHYLGWEAICIPPKWNPHNVRMGQGGGYVISQAVLRNHKWNFASMATRAKQVMKDEDCMFAVTLFNELRLRLLGFPMGVFYFLNDGHKTNQSIEINWSNSRMNVAKRGLSGCVFAWHKVEHSFRLKLIAQHENIPFHKDHCKQIAWGRFRGFRWRDQRNKTMQVTSKIRA